MTATSVNTRAIASHRRRLRARAHRNLAERHRHGALAPAAESLRSSGWRRPAASRAPASGYAAFDPSGSPGRGAAFFASGAIKPTPSIPAASPCCFTASPRSSSLPAHRLRRWSLWAAAIIAQWPALRCPSARAAPAIPADAHQPSRPGTEESPKAGRWIEPQTHLSIRARGAISSRIMRASRRPIRIFSLSLAV